MIKLDAYFVQVSNHTYLFLFFQVCANHYITADMQVQPKPDSDKVMMWIAADFADGGTEPTYEKFAMRFKTAEFALAFKEKVDECKILLGGSGLAPKKADDLSTSVLLKNADKMKNELGFFKDKMTVNGQKSG